MDSISRKKLINVRYLEENKLELYNIDFTNMQINKVNINIFNDLRICANMVNGRKKQKKILIKFSMTKIWDIIKFSKLNFSSVT